ncbi:hypothetical protein AB8A20_08090 [Tardiphaga sp. 604_B6_N1_1]|uniref:hypothetical protein n=1 Tax=unclassified Tardiphaga TaxID=2631404 RepID=UPI003F283A63
MKNRLSDLNDHLFAQIERLSDEALTDEQMEREVRRGTAIVAAADQIIRSAVVQVQAAKTASDHGIDPTPWLPETKTPGTRLKIVGPGR